MVPQNAVGINNNGLMTEAMTTTPKIPKPICMQSNKVDGNHSSTAPMSFAKRFKILPDGLWLKNLIFARVMLENIL